MVIDLAAVWCGEPALSSEVLLAVAGAHLSGQPLNHELVRRGGRLAFGARTAPEYRMYLLEGPRPGLPRTVAPLVGGPGIEVEVWSLPAGEFAGFAATVEPPLALGPLELSDGQRVLGFVCTADGADPDREITEHGSWRGYLA